MSRMQITILSSDRRHLEELAQVVKSDPELGAVQEIQGGEAELDGLADRPDVLIVNGAVAAGGGFEPLERFGARSPGTAFIVVSDNRSPEFLLRAMRAGVREVLPDPANPAELHAAIGRVARRGAARAHRGKVVSFISCRGGSGSTFLATNLGYVLAGRGLKVALFDLNLQFGNAALLVSEQRPETNLAEVAEQIQRLDASLLAASMVPVLPNYGLLAAPDDPARAINVGPQPVKALIELASRHYDVVIADLDRRVDAVCLQALDLSDVVFAVLQVSLPCIRDGRRLTDVLRSLEYPPSKVQLIVNRFEKGGEIALADVEKALGLKTCITVPNSYRAVTQAVNQGVPLPKLAPKNGVARSLEALSRLVVPEAERARAGWLSRMLAGH
jgi:pilus assembly protein CpaE